MGIYEHFFYILIYYQYSCFLLSGYTWKTNNAKAFRLHGIIWHMEKHMESYTHLIWTNWDKVFMLWYRENMGIYEHFFYILIYYQYSCFLLSGYTWKTNNAKTFRLHGRIWHMEKHMESYTHLICTDLLSIKHGFKLSMDSLVWYNFMDIRCILQGYQLHYWTRSIDGNHNYNRAYSNFNAWLLVFSTWTAKMVLEPFGVLLP